MKTSELKMKSTMFNHEQRIKKLEKGNENSGTSFETGIGLKLEDNVLSVDSAKDFEGDNTRPVEAAFMQEQIGNIELLLKTI